jgi:hypothetical protein
MGHDLIGQYQFLYRQNKVSPLPFIIMTQTSLP